MTKLDTSDAPARLLACATAVAQMRGDIPSPCISVCVMDAQTGLCKGCFRTLDEIAAWGGQGDAARRAVWHALELRARA